MYNRHKGVTAMKERIYTIPVNEAFDPPYDRCPFCRLYEKLEEDEIQIMLGSAMMDPAIRQATNESGFCSRHYNMMFEKQNRLGLALILESHLDTLKKGLKKGTVFAPDIGNRSVSRIETLEKTCYVCDKIEEKISKMFTTAVYLFDEEKDFRAKFDKTPYLCLPHYKKFVLTAKRVLDKDSYNTLVTSANLKITNYLASLKDDVSWFAKKFDYRFDSEPWGNSKDSVERAIRFLNGDSALGDK